MAISFRGHEAGPDSPTAGRAGAGDVSASGGVVVACPATLGGRDMALEHWKVEEARAPVCFDRSLSTQAITDEKNACTMTRNEKVTRILSVGKKSGVVIMYILFMIVLGSIIE